MRIGEILLLARELKGWSQRELQGKSGINHAVIAQMETGHIKSPSFIKVAKLAKALNISLDRIAKIQGDTADEGDVEA
jgi:transcriptional regulator with XRE-family HTH domain